MEDKNTPIAENSYVEELLAIIRSNISKEELLEKLDDYHDNDIASAIELLSEEERKKLYPVLGVERVSQIITYVEDPTEILKEISLENAAKVISQMDSDDAVDILENLEDETQEEIVKLMDDESSHDVQLILSYDDGEVGSVMTTNYIVIQNNLSIKKAMHELTRQAGDNDNISTIYVVDENEKYYGAIELKDLIRAREGSPLEDIISTSYPFVLDHDQISDCIEKLKDYAEDSIPVLNKDDNILGVITSQDIVEVVDEEMGDDYAKLAGLTAEEDLNEPIRESIKKRIPWLVTLLLLGLIVSSAIGIFEQTVVAIVPIVAIFQSLVFDMSGNTGTQSLAVTIRVLMDEGVGKKQKSRLVFKEVRVGICNGLILGLTAFVVVGLYILVFKAPPEGYSSFAYAFTISGCIAGALFCAMIIASLVGTTIPMLLHKIGVDPAVASGPMITTVNDLIAAMVYYGLAWVFLVNMFHMHG